MCRVAAVKHLPVHNHSADYIFMILLDHWGYILSFENRVPLKPVLGAWLLMQISLPVMNRLNKTEFAIFISLI